MDFRSEQKGKSRWSSHLPQHRIGESDILNSDGFEHSAWSKHDRSDGYHEQSEAEGTGPKSQFGNGRRQIVGTLSSATQSFEHTIF